MPTRIIYAVNVSVAMSIHDDWLQWMKNTHMPELMATGCFTGCRMSRITESDDSNGQRAFIIHYFCENKAQLENYQAHYAATLQKDHRQRYKDGVFTSRTILEEIITMSVR